MRLILGMAFGVALLTTACSSSSGTSGFSVTSATVDSGYTCPRGASNAAYDLHASVRLHNPTSRPVTVEAVRAAMTLEAVKGSWLEKIGETYEVGSASFGPGIVSPGTNLAMNVTIPSACTNGTTAAGAGSYGDYQVKLSVVTTEGTFSIGGAHLHRITAA